MALSLNQYPVQFLQTMEEAFPEVDPGCKPFGSRVLVQTRVAKRKTAGGIELTEETRETIAYNVQIGKVRAMGPLAFHNRTTLEPWPEGQWCRVGDFVRIPKYGGDRWEKPIPDAEEQTLFVIFNDLDLIGLLTEDPRNVLAFV